jgi:hypothetical protein
MKISRREFIAGTAALSVSGIGSSLQAQPDPYDVLIAGQYANDVQFIQQEAGKYLGVDYKLAESPSTWTLQMGRYPGKYNGHPVDLHGYWIFRKGLRRCIQAVNYGAGPLDTWNKDSRASGNPEDWELFTFEKVSKQDRTVKIYNTAYVAHREFSTGEHFASDWRYYINLVGNSFSCNDTGNHAAIFIVKFGPNFH